MPSKTGPERNNLRIQVQGGVNCKVSTATSTGMEHAFFRLANSDHVKAKYRVLRICPLCGHSFKPRSDAWSDYHVAQCWEEHQVEVEDECKEDLELVLWDLKEDFRNSYHLQLVLHYFRRSLYWRANAFLDSDTRRDQVPSYPASQKASEEAFRRGARGLRRESKQVSGGPRNELVAELSIPPETQR